MMSPHRYCAWLTGLVLTLSYVLAVAQNTIELQPDKGLLVIDGHPFVLQGSTVIGPGSCLSHFDRRLELWSGRLAGS
jgi:hypothetical protein